MRAPGWLPAVGVALIAAGFTWLNRGERVAVDLGLFRFYRAPLTLVAFAAFLAGMLAMLLLSLRHDRRVRDELRARGLLEPARPEPARAAAASAWGVAREPEPHPAYPRATDERTVAYARDEDERAIGFSGDGAPRTSIHPHGTDERTVAYAVDDQRIVAHPRDEDERTVAYAGDDEPRTTAHPRDEDDRTISYRRYDEDPAV